jgi:hypothetical protein
MNSTLNNKTKLNFSNQPKQLAEYGDGLIRYGDYISFGN